MTPEIGMTPEAGSSVILKLQESFGCNDDSGKFRNSRFCLLVKVVSVLHPNLVSLQK